MEAQKEDPLHADRAEVSGTLTREPAQNPSEGWCLVATVGPVTLCSQAEERLRVSRRPCSAARRQPAPGASEDSAAL